MDLLDSTSFGERVQFFVESGWEMVGDNYCGYMQKFFLWIKFKIGSWLLSAFNIVD